MPYAAPKNCLAPGCGTKATDGGHYCDAHRKAKVKAKRRQAERGRASASARGYGVRWRKARAAYLRSHQLCVRCRDEGRIASAVVVDHIEPHRGDMTKFWDQSNWQALCKACHDAKTAREDGGGWDGGALLDG